jgi:hypothetical protein
MDEVTFILKLYKLGGDLQLWVVLHCTLKTVVVLTLLCSYFQNEFRISLNFLIYWSTYVATIFDPVFLCGYAYLRC